MKKGLWYSVTLIVIFIIAVGSGDRLFFVPTPPPSPSIDTAIVKRYVSPYISISPYDRYFREAADSIHWDWKLLAAIGFTESRFDSTAISGVGARGIMQVMPRTLRSLGVPDSMHMDTRSNIMAASKLLKDLNRIFRRIDNLDERTNFILASYNAGIGQVSDAMRLAEKYGHNRYKWNNSVDSFLKFKSLPQYYNDELCKNGKFKDWKQTLQFVKKVKRTWQKYEEMQEAYNDSIYEILLNDSTVEVNKNL
ncbi:MAG: transglycosylase SLT domain-containing protein [Bacteroidaceae bacterium]|nr:transglycosylase SLT domain-containing protein [Bacteroidaceae bacterium]MBQ3538232.1 transglycosylase SLT domain-containing protein [Bacteroidaceae bacterium]MBQ6694388.1 transglycosylase SLT domain-containing protein [Bacteroidaceae bacterium]